MIFTINFLNIKIDKDSYKRLHYKIIEDCQDCIVHDCITESEFTIQLKSRDYQKSGRIEVTGKFNGSNSIVVKIEKEFQTPWALQKMEELVNSLQEYDKFSK